MFKAKIKEYFLSIQGEGQYVGYKQLFIRFCGCNLNCAYCDTDFSADSNCPELSASELFKLLTSKKMLENIHSISLTGGEPLIHADFLTEFLPLFNKKVPIYLETNATLSEQFGKISNYIDIISADIKLPSSSGKDLFLMHDKFFEACSGKDLFAKVVFDEKITDEEIKRVCTLTQKYNIEIVLSPVMKGKTPVLNAKSIENIHNKFLKYYRKTRVIPQVHKFLDIE